MIRLPTRRLLLALSAAGAMLVVGGCNSNGLNTPAGTGDPIADALGDPLVMLGLRTDPNKTEIEYGPRSPLVMPSEARLPPPQQQVADLGPEWPDDPNVRARREYEAQRRAAAEHGVREVEQASEPRSRADLDEWGRRFGRISNDPAPRSTRDPSAAWSAEELRAGAADPNAPLVEPERRALTDPPTGYRAPAPTAPMEAEPEKKGFFSRLFGR